MRRRTALLDLTAPGWLIVCCAALLATMGIATIWIADTAYKQGHDGPDNALKQLAILLGASVLGAGILKLGYRRIARLAYPFFFLSLLLLIPPILARTTHQTFGGLVPMVNGAYRWIRLPLFQLQPSEVMKIGMIFALACYLRYRRNYRTLKGLLLPVLGALVPLALILLEPDLGTAMLILPLVFVMLFMAGAKTSHLLGIAGVGLLLAPLAWSKMEGYQRMRITAVLLQSDAVRDAIRRQPQRYGFLASRREVEYWSRDSGYQLLRSKYAVGSGGLAGEGWGEGPFTEYALLPEGHNDFIFALLAHQWGWLGCAAVIAAYAGLVGAGAAVALATKEPFGRLVAVGIVAMLAMQAGLNVGMVTGLMPVTGVTLPLVSYGGCSLLINVVALAVLISISQHRPFLLANRPFNFALRSRRAIPLELAKPPREKTASETAA
ncbi:MAG: rod shape-determining protein RodA [Phycisphaerales bacterium]|nr:rod shape-determining protein RodA [Phycisphaerales bacterium]